MFIPLAPIRVAPRANARATAYCLDIRAKTPPAGHEFKYSAASKEDLSVDIAGKTYTIQSAIDAGKIAVLGAGDHESLENKKTHRLRSRRSSESPSSRSSRQDVENR